MAVWQVSYFSYRGFAYILYNEKLETLCLLELDSFLSVKEGSLHSIAQDYCNIPMETGEHYFCSLYLWQHSMSHFSRSYVLLKILSMGIFIEALISESHGGYVGIVFCYIQFDHLFRENYAYASIEIL